MENKTDYAAGLKKFCKFHCCLCMRRVQKVKIHHV